MCIQLTGALILYLLNELIKDKSKGSLYFHVHKSAVNPWIPLVAHTKEDWHNL